ncbi:transketolase [bacterium]|nr:transketolase [bacterium]
MNVQPIQRTFSEVDSKAVNTIRILAAEMVEKAKSGHPGMPMGFAVAAHVLFSRFMRFNPDDPFWPNRDRFILSAGHGSALQYILLHMAGYDLQMEDLKQFRQWKSRTPGHPEFGFTAGVETTTGPLGQGFANGIGMATARRYVRESLGLTRVEEGFDPLDHFVYVVASDGDLMEGISSEAGALAGRWKLGHLIVLYDSNRISIDGSTDLSMTEDMPKRFEAQGWHGQDVEDGNDPEAIYDAIVKAQAVSDRPSIIEIHTHIGYGSPNKQDHSSSHGSPLGEEELALTRETLGWEHPPFTIPDEVYELYSEVADRGRVLHEAWRQNLDLWLGEDESRAAMWRHMIQGEDPAGWDESLPLFSTDEKVATRAAFGKVHNAVGARVRTLFGGCADLTGSVKTDIKGEQDFLPELPGGRNIRYGVREHAMGAISNGMALYAALRPYTGTFLIFSDYMRPAIRVAALMQLPVLFVFSHDSIGLGEDGPTHQPVEHYSSLRAIPELWVFRPGDANETVQAWRAALLHKDGPTAFLTTRQKLPTIDRDRYASAEGVLKGGYILADCKGDPELILISTGSELHLAIDAYETLIAEGRRIRVVSLPCWELFEEQSEEYMQSVLPDHITNRLAIEVGVSFGWSRWVGGRGKVYSLEGFGASAPSDVLFKKFGFTSERILGAARAMLDESGE